MPDDGPKVASWSEVTAELAPSRNYWLNTINRDNSPHPSPVWGVVLGEHLYFYTSRITVKARNLARDARAAVHLESAENVVIVHGRAVDLGEPSRSSEVLNALSEKYDEPGDGDYLPSSNESFDVLYRFEAHKALLWRLADFDSSQRRWAAPRAEG
jgi:nitroimidazol reductase NimA-like FMN-containing flavoprotein (pyridoxamine 5'-phosphate oxidase superfamily)